MVRRGPLSQKIATPEGIELPKTKPGQLPLEIISKGRFEKSEPTVHHGQDLDMPTYIRRNMPLN